MYRSLLEGREAKVCVVGLDLACVSERVVLAIVNLANAARKPGSSQQVRKTFAERSIEHTVGELAVRIIRVRDSFSAHKLINCSQR